MIKSRDIGRDLGFGPQFVTGPAIIIYYKDFEIECDTVYKGDRHYLKIWD